MEIKAITKSWSETKKLEACISTALEELKLKASVGYVMSGRSAEACVLTPPGLILDGKVLFEGRIPSVEELTKMFREIQSV